MSRALHPPADVALISLPTPFRIGRVNAYLLDGDPLTLIDPGPHMGNVLSALEAGMVAAGHRLEEVELILLTHQHHDHVGQAERVREISGAEIGAVSPLADYLRDFERSIDLDDRYAVATMLRHGVEPQVAESLRQLSAAFHRFVRSAHVERRLAHGERMRAGGRSLTVLLRPGHSPTDTLFFDESDGTLIGGDHLLETVSSNPVAHFWSDGSEPEAAALSPERRRPLAEYLDSLRQTSELDVSMVLPGHGEPFVDHRALIEQRARMHARRARKLLGSIEDRMTAADLGRVLWGGMPVTEVYLVLSEVLGHMDLLKAEGLVREVDEDGLVRFERA